MDGRKAGTSFIVSELYAALVAFAGKMYPLRPQPVCIPVCSCRHVARKQSGCSVHVTLRIPLDMMYFFYSFVFSFPFFFLSSFRLLSSK